ncbi:MAG: YbjN domain-containing protein [Muribaculaceae bacterium]
MSGYSHLINFLQNEGYRHEERETSVRFKIQGVNYVGFRNNDSAFLQIVLMCNTEGQDRIKLLEACNDLNSKKFVVKFTVTEDSDGVWASYEFEPTASTTPQDYEGIFGLLDRATDELFQLLRE